MTISSSKSSPNSGLESTKKFAKSMLRNSMFIGDFKEKRLVDRINAYRDVITVCPGETEFIQNLVAVKNKLDLELVSKSWVGISTPETIGAPVGYNLWVVLPQEVFGTYWYRVKTVEFLSDEIRLKVDIVRPYQKESTPLRGSKEADISFSDICREKKETFKENLLYFFKHMVTAENLKEVVTFLCILISTICLGAISMAKYLLEYMLCLIREISFLIKSASPIVQGMFSMVTKCIYGFYHLICVLLRKPAPVYNNYISVNREDFADPRIRYNKYFNDRALPYYPNSQRRGPTITPLD